MFQLPQFPGWDGLHPLIIHLPMDLLFAALLFVILGAVVSPPRGRVFFQSALILMVLGTASIFLAMETGKAVGGLLPSDPAVKAAMDEHRDLAEATLVLFAALTLAFAAFLFVPDRYCAGLGRRIKAALLAVFLIFYATGVLFLVNTADHGRSLGRNMAVRSAKTQSVSATMSSTH